MCQYSLLRSKRHLDYPKPLSLTWCLYKDVCCTLWKCRLRANCFEDINWMGLQTFAWRELTLIIKDRQSKCNTAGIISHLCWRPGGISCRLVTANSSDHPLAPRLTQPYGQPHDTVLVQDLLHNHGFSIPVLDHFLFSHYLFSVRHEWYKRP